MHSSIVFIAATLSLAGSSAARTVLTTITPCPTNSYSYPASVYKPPITVTRQYQPISSCIPTTICNPTGSCSTHYPFTTTTYLHTTLPCNYDGTTTSECLVTNTDQVIPVAKSTTVLTNLESSGAASGVVPVYTTVVNYYQQVYKSIGPHGLPGATGYSGSGICKACQKVQSDGSHHQEMNVYACSSSASNAPATCVASTATFVQSSAPVVHSATSVVASSNAKVTKPGTYTFTFPQTLPPITTTEGSSTYTLQPAPWTIKITETAKKATTFHIKSTVSHDIPFTTPLSTQSGSVFSTVPIPTDPYQGTPIAGTTVSTSTTTTTSLSTSSSSTTTSSSVTPSATTLVTTTTTTTIVIVSSSPTTSSSSTTTTSTSSTTTTSSSSTTTTSSSASNSSGPSQPSSGGFYIQAIDAAYSRFRKRTVSLVGMSADGGVIVGDLPDAALFYLDSGNELLWTEGREVGSEVANGYTVFEALEVDDVELFSVYVSGWSTAGGQLTFNNPAFAAPAQFCVMADGVLLITLGSAPSSCTTVSLIVYNPNQSQSSGTGSWSTTATTTSSTTTTTTTSCTPDPSSDPEPPTVMVTRELPVARSIGKRGRISGVIEEIEEDE